MMKKVTAAFLAAVMVMGLAACGGGDGSAPADSGNQDNAGEQGNDGAEGQENAGEDREVWTCTIPWPSID